MTLLALKAGLESHNPDNLTPAQVGEGWRLVTKSEMLALPEDAQCWGPFAQAWRPSCRANGLIGLPNITYRTRWIAIDGGESVNLKSRSLIAAQHLLNESSRRVQDAADFHTAGEPAMADRNLSEASKTATDALQIIKLLQGI